MDSEKSDALPRPARVSTLGELRRQLEPFDDEMKIFAGDPSDLDEPPVLITIVRKREGGLQAPWEWILCLGAD